MCRCDLPAWGLGASRLAARPPSDEVNNAEAARRPGICPRPPGCRFDPRRDASLQPFSRSATVLAQERYSAVVMQSCGCQRPETILVIRVVRGFEHGNAALAVQQVCTRIRGQSAKTNL